MKQCRTCNRAYSDDTQNFCLDDGTPLVVAYDPDATQVINPTSANQTTIHESWLKSGVPTALVKYTSFLCMILFLMAMGLSMSLKNGYLTTLLAWFQFVSIVAFGRSMSYGDGKRMPWKYIRKLPMPFVSTFVLAIWFVFFIIELTSRYSRAERIVGRERR